MTAKYSVKAASNLTGISTDTLRAWERRYSAVTPQREGKDRRFYNDDDLERLRLLREACELGHPIRIVAAQNNEDLRRLVSTGTQSVRSMDKTSTPVLNRLLKAVHDFDAPAFGQSLGQAAAGLDSKTLIIDVILPLLHEVGERWYRGELTVAQEHMVTAELRNMIGTLIRLLPRHKDGPRILFATLSGEQHEFGVLLASLIATGMGYDIHYLGPDTPPADVAHAAERTGCRVVAISCVRVADDQLASAQVEKLRGLLLAGIELWIGGSGAARIAPLVAGTGIVFMEDLIDFERRLEMIQGKAGQRK